MTTPNSPYFPSLRSFPKQVDSVVLPIKTHEDSLRFNQKKRTTGAGRSRLSFPTPTRCHLKKIKDSYAIQGYDELEIPTLLEGFRRHLTPRSLLQESLESEIIEEVVEKAKRVLREKDKTFGIKKRLKEMCKKALQSVYYMCGFSLASLESEIIEEIVQRVLKEIPSDGHFKPPQNQVFINFRGAQLRNYLIAYLVDALHRRKVNVFIDNLEKRGEKLDNLFKRIEDSGIAIVVFSSRYTESEWVMDELVKIVECERQGRLKVLPVFHNVSPSDVERQKGEFGDHFRDKELVYGSDSPKIKEWKDAINYASHKFPLTFDEKSGALEIDFVESIVKEVLAMLQAISTVESGQSSS